jgi:hypothetical protein
MMKKTIVFLAALLVAVSPAAAGPSYYGLSGFAFIPTARTGTGGSHGVAVTSCPGPFETFTAYPFSLRLSLMIMDGIEVGVTNTYRYFAAYDESYGLFVLPGGGFVAATSNLIAPIIPSAKFSFLDTAVPNGAIAVGFEYPFGAFAVVDYVLTILPELSFHFSTGIASTFVTLSAFGGVRASLPLGFMISLEGAYSGKTDYLTRSQEAFLALDLGYEVTEGMFVDFMLRLDQDGTRRLSVGFVLDL